MAIGGGEDGLPVHPQLAPAAPQFGLLAVSRRIALDEEIATAFAGEKSDGRLRFRQECPQAGTVCRWEEIDGDAMGRHRANFAERQAASDEEKVAQATLLGGAGDIVDGDQVSHPEPTRPVRKPQRQLVAHLAVLERAAKR